MFKRLTQISKRRRLMISTAVLTVLLIISTFFNVDESQFFIILIGVAAYFFTFFSILEGISDKEWLVLFIPPVYFTLVFYFFYFFLPQRWLTRLPFVTIYAISIYALLLSQNIFNIGAEKSLQLFRAASSVNYLYLTISEFLISSLILSLKLLFIYNFVLMFIASFPLALQFLWAVNPKESIDREVVRYAWLIAFIIAQGALVFSFIPLSSAVFALLLTACFYSLCGLFQAYLQARLFKERIREYIFVMGFISGIVILSLRW